MGRNETKVLSRYQIWHAMVHGMRPKKATVGGPGSQMV